MELLGSLQESMDRRQKALFFVLKSYENPDVEAKVRYCEAAAELTGDTFVMRQLLYA